MESINVAGVQHEAGDDDSRSKSDSKCKLIISPFLTFPHLIDCLICTRNFMSVVLSLELMVGSAGLHWGCLIYIRVWVRQRGASYHLIVLGVFLFFLFLYFFCLISSVHLFRWLEHDGCCVCFFVFSLLSFSLVPLSRSYYCGKKCVCYVKLFQSYLIIILWIFLEKGECFDFNHPLESV